MTRGLVVSLAAAALVAAACGGGGSAERVDLFGPGTNGQWYATGGVADVGETLSFGNTITLAPTTTQTVTVRSIELIGVHGLVVTGIAVNGTSRNFNMVGSAREFPPPQASSDRVTLPTTLRPDDTRATQQGLALTFGIRRTSEGRGYATGFEVAYEMGGKSYHQRFKTGLALCAIRGFAPSQRKAPPCKSVPNQLT